MKAINEAVEKHKLILAQYDFQYDLASLDKEKVIVFNDVRDAYPFISFLVNKKDVYALFENDLPDIFNEK